MPKRLTIATFAAMLLAGAAHAGQQPPQDAPPRGPRPDPLAMADRNKDGVVTREEMLAGVETRFKAMDANHDGKVSAEERESYTAAMRARMGGGRLRAPKDMTLADEQARAGRMFDRVDANHDGKIDAAERDAAAQRMLQMRRGPGGRRGGPAGDMPPPPPPADGD